MDIDNNIVSHEVLTTSNKIPFSINSINPSFKTDFTKKNLINFSNSNLSKKINDFSKIMGHSNINLNTLNIYANNSFNKNLNNSLSNELYASALEESSKTDIDFTENNHPCPTENSLGLDSNLESNSIRLSNINNSNSISSTNVTSFTTTANPIPIPVNSSSFHTNENRNLTSYSYVNSVETPTTLSIENINEKLNSSDNINSLSLFYKSDIDLNNSLNSNNISILNNSLMTLQPHQQQQHQQQQQQKQQQQQQQQHHQSSVQPQAPTFMTTTTANPLLSHAQAKNVSFTSHLSTNFNNGESNALLNANMNTNSLDHFTSSSTVIKQEPELESAIKMKLHDSINPLTKSYNTYADKSSMDMDMNLETDYPSNLSDFSNLSSSIPIPPPPPPSQSSSDINGSLDLNTMITKKISNLHIHSLMDLNNQELSSSTSTNTNIPSTKEVFTNLQSSTSFSTNVNHQFTTSATTSSSAITPAAVTTATATTTPITTASINPINNLYYSGVNSSNLKHKINNSIIYRKSYIKKPQQQYEKSLSNSKYLNYPLSSSLKLVKKEPGTKINYVKKKVSMKTAMSSSLDTKLSSIDEINKKYNNNLLHTPHHHSVGINKDINNMISPSFVITSPEHVNKPLDNYELSNQIQQVPVSVVTPNNSYSGNNLFVRSNTLAIPTRKIRNYGYDSQSLGSSHTTKTIQNQHIVNSSLNEELFNGGGSNSFPYKYNPPYHKGYISLASQLDILNEKRKKRKESHNATERRRRDFINEKIFELSTLIPESFFDQCANENRTHKGVILQKSVDYINHLLNSLKTQQEYTSKLEKEINNQASTTPQNS